MCAFLALAMAHTMSMRANYETMGVEAFYKQHGPAYRNPHDAAIRRALKLALSRWETAHPELVPFNRALDLACGSGEVTVAVQEWLAARDRWPAAGTVQLEAADPYTQASFKERVGRPCRSFSFEDVQNGCLLDLVTAGRYGAEAGGSGEGESVGGADPGEGCGGRGSDGGADSRVDGAGEGAEEGGAEEGGAGAISAPPPFAPVISSFALHLIDKSRLYGVLTQLAMASSSLVVVTPHKNPHITDSMGFSMVDEVREEGIRLRLYRSLLC